MTEDTENGSRLGRVYRLERDRGFALISPLIVKGDRPIFLHASKLDSTTWESLEVGTWLQLSIEDGPKGPQATVAMITHPDPVDLQKRLLERYSATPGMAGGVNPGSHRLDGLTHPEAKRWWRAGAMTPDQYLGCMSENGIRGFAGSYDVDTANRTREELVIAMLDLIGNESNESENE